MKDANPSTVISLYAAAIYTVAMVGCGVMIARAFYSSEIRRLKAKIALYRAFGQGNGDASSAVTRAVFLKRGRRWQ